MIEQNDKASENIEERLDFKKLLGFNQLESMKSIDLIDDTSKMFNKIGIGEFD